MKIAIWDFFVFDMLGHPPHNNSLAFLWLHSYVKVLPEIVT